MVYMDIIGYIWLFQLMKIIYTYTSIWNDTVAGSEIQRSPVEVGSLSRYLQGLGYIPGGWGWDFFHHEAARPSSEVYGSATQCMARDPGTTLELQFVVVSVLFGQRDGKKNGQKPAPVKSWDSKGDKPMQLVPSGQDLDKIQKVENESVKMRLALTANMVWLISEWFSCYPIQVEYNHMRPEVLQNCCWQMVIAPYAATPSWERQHYNLCRRIDFLKVKKKHVSKLETLKKNPWDMNGFRKLLDGKTKF